MLAVTLNMIRKGDQSALLTVYSQEHGRISFLVFGAFSRKANKACYEPFTLVDISYTPQPNRDIQTLTSISLAYIPKDSTNVPRHCVRMYAAELVSEVIRYPEKDDALFGFLSSFAVQIDTAEDITTLPVAFRTQLAVLLGFDPSCPPFPTTQSEIILREIL